MSPRADLCVVCGTPTAAHFDAANRFLACADLAAGYDALAPCEIRLLRAVFGGAEAPKPPAAAKRAPIELSRDSVAVVPPSAAQPSGACPKVSHGRDS